MLIFARGQVAKRTGFIVYSFRIYQVIDPSVNCTETGITTG